ncbi:MAG: hypothetical protein ICV60_01895 [Pyrinomonadaceae bacterium]|nr:hypothetical protein [Pyrinomonadaceae bacterium]
MPEMEDATRVEEARPFSHEEMVTCAECLRANPPTRSNCFYCSAKLPLQETAAASRRRLALRQPEKWEEGYNVILGERAPEASDELLGEVSELLKLEREAARRILESAKPLPLARVDSSEEAGLVAERLGTCGLSVLVVSDSDLMMKDEHRRRARAFDFENAGLVAHAAGSKEAWRAAWADITLMVTGRLVTRRVEMEERRKTRGSEAVVAREMTGDVLLLDLYTKDYDGGWRVASDSFDFSCLKERKALIASQNFATLVEVIRERAPRVMVDDSYNGLRQALASIWPPEERTQSGLRRERPGRFNVEAVMTSDNERQFTRYSRLRHYLLLGEAGEGRTSA